MRTTVEDMLIVRRTYNRSAVWTSRRRWNSCSEGQARFESRMVRLTSYQIEAEARHEREMLEIRTQLKRAVQMEVEESRRERQRRLEMHQEIAESMQGVAAAQQELAAAQKLTEQKFQRQLDSRQS